MNSIARRWDASVVMVWVKRPGSPAWDVDGADRENLFANLTEELVRLSKGNLGEKFQAAVLGEVVDCGGARASKQIPRSSTSQAEKELLRQFKLVGD
jgi:hypothetical protein